MYREINQQRIKHIYRMLLKMGAGDFSCRIPRTEKDDELEALAVLINWLAEEMKESVFHSGYINPHFTYRYVTQSIYILDDNFVINDFSADVPALLGLEPEEISGRNFAEILEAASLPVWQNTKAQLLQDVSCRITLPLGFVTPEKLLVPLFCSVSRFFGGGKIIVSTFRAVQQTAADTTTEQETSDREETGSYRYPDVHLIQAVYDFILAYKEGSFPTLKKLARIFGTNEYKLKTGFKYLFKTTIYQFYNDQRLSRSLLLIENTAIPLKNIAFMAGFSTYPNFSRAFKIKYGYPPSTVTRKSSAKSR